MCENGAAWADKQGRCLESSDGYPLCGDPGCPDGFGGGVCQVDLSLRTGVRLVGVATVMVQVGIMVLLISCRETPVFRAASPALSVISQCGVLLATMAVFPLSEYHEHGEPQDDHEPMWSASCVLSPLFINFGFVFIAVPMFVRVYRISKVGRVGRVGGSGAWVVERGEERAFPIANNTPPPSIAPTLSDPLAGVQQQEAAHDRYSSKGYDPFMRTILDPVGDLPRGVDARRRA